MLSLSIVSRQDCRYSALALIKLAFLHGREARWFSKHLGGPNMSVDIADNDGQIA
jgi:hypothetical protein